MESSTTTPTATQILGYFALPATRPQWNADMTKLPLLAGLLLAVPLFAFAQSTPSSANDAQLQKRVERVLTRTPLIDGHNDLPGAISMGFGNVGNIDLAADTSNLQG